MLGGMKMKRKHVAGGLLLAAALLCGVMSAGTVTALAQAETETETAQEEQQPTVSGQITSCKITGDKQNIEIGFTVSGDSAGTDGKVYLFELKPYEDEIGSRTNYAASAQAGGSSSVTVPLYLGTEKDRLYSKFVLAVFDGTAFSSIRT